MTSEDDRDYSTLEVDREAESHAKILVQHESTLEAYTPEAQKDASAPQVVDGDPPERFYEHGNDGGVQPRSRRICGLQRTAFYLVLTVIALVVIGAAIGGGVGASLSSNTSDDAEPTSTASASQPPGTLSPTTRLASINYTDESGIDYFLVYYQLSSKVICQSRWNNSKQSWTASIVSNDTDNIMANSPISADLWRNNASSRNIDVYWLQPNNVIRGSTRLGSKKWGDNGINGKYIAYGVTSYAKECSSCFNNNVVIYYGTDKTLEFVITSPKWQQKPFPSSFPRPVNGSDISLKPIYANNGSKYLVLHMNPAKGGNLTQIVWDGSAWAYNETLPTSLSTNTSIASFTAGYNDTNSPTYTIQVLTTDSSDSAGHVTVTAYNARLDKWESTRNVPGFEDILDGSPLAANQAGRVYGLVAGTDGETKIAQWVWHSGNDSYTRAEDVSIFVPKQ